MEIVSCNIAFFSKSYELVYAIQNADKGAPEDIYRALQVAYEKGILSEGEDSRWDEGITKTEAMELITNTFMSMPSVHGLEKGQGNGTALEVVETSVEEETSTELADELAEDSTALYENSVIETETDEEEDYIRYMVEQGEMSAEVEEAEIEALDETRYATMNVRLREGTATTTEAIRTIQFAEAVQVTGKTADGQWFKVKDSQNNEGYVASSYLSLEKPSQYDSLQQTTQSSSNGGGSTQQSQPESTRQDNGYGVAPSGVSQSDWDAVMQHAANQSTELPSETGLTGDSGGGYTLGY